jgi:hypothetical protein
MEATTAPTNQYQANMKRWIGSIPSTDQTVVINRYAGHTVALFSDGTSANYQNWAYAMLAMKDAGYTGSGEW